MQKDQCHQATLMTLPEGHWATILVDDPDCPEAARAFIHEATLNKDTKPFKKLDKILVQYLPVLDLWIVLDHLEG